MNRSPRKSDFAVVGVLAFLCAPFNIGGNVWTIMGNARSENSVYPVFSVYQDAKKDAASIFGIGYQNGGSSVRQGIGISYQNGGKDAVQLVGVTIQHAGGRAENYISVALWQQVAERVRTFAIWSTLESEKK